MTRTHRRSLLWQSACILLPLLLLAGLAVWQLTDARTVALEEARADAELLAQRIAERCEQRFETVRAQLPQFRPGEFERFLYPLSPEPAADGELHQRYLATVHDCAALGELLPLIGDALTPAGVPLQPLARFRVAELSNFARDPTEAALSCAIDSHPSVLTGHLLARARSALAPENAHLDELDERWARDERLRRSLRKAPPAQLRFDESHWVKPDLAGRNTDIHWLSVRDGAARFINDAILRGIPPSVVGEIAPPAHFGVAIRFHDHDYQTAAGKQLAAAGAGEFLVRATLLDESALLADVRAQTYWYAAVIALSTLAALLGLLGLRRSYARQLELGEMKSNFVASVSHELRAPVASVRLLAERLRSGTVTDEAKRDEYYGFIEGESRRLGTLVENILDFSRIERGQKDYHFEQTDLAALVRDAVASMVHYAAERHVVVDSNITDEDTHAEADPTEMRQALVNLLDNAIKFSPENGSITVGLDRAEGGARVRLWVRDHGPGVPAAERDKIFERFYRSGSELTRETQGAGIGLSIVKHIAEGHGGGVSLECPPGGGSRFTITIPTEQPNHA